MPLTVKVILAACVVLVLYGGLCLVSPVGKCLRCHGEGTVARLGRRRPCPQRCNRGRAPRPGARRIHSLLWEHVGPWLRVRLHDLADRMREARP